MAVLVGLAVIVVIAVALFVFGVFTPQAPLQIAGGLPACESGAVQAGIRDFVAAREPGREEAIVSVQEIGRKPGPNGGPVVRRDCQVSFRTAEGYERVVLELAADGANDGAAWHLSMGQIAEPPLAAPPPQQER
ncbi:hypothetical protein ACM64Y_16905 [Novispirillum sp. DQ9]|uniref:hypothetical protein n=1 Tax=Novispirillum sp. DQ9 TaxID=3398612 RepID=UPI003C7EB0BE